VREDRLDAFGAMALFAVTLLLAFNQISNNCGMLHYTSGGQYKVPMVIRGPGGVGRQLGAEHSQRLESYFQSIPGVQLVAVSTVANAKALLKAQGLLLVNELTESHLFSHLTFGLLEGWWLYEDAELRLPGLLFVNFSPMTLRHLLADHGRGMAALLALPAAAAACSVAAAWWLPFFSETC
jgi:hypothetical protein